MICRDLEQLWQPTLHVSAFSPAALVAGARAVVEPYSRPECKLSTDALVELHNGMDSFLSFGYEYGIGWRQERRDLEQWLRWSRNLATCMADRRVK